MYTYIYIYIYQTNGELLVAQTPSVFTGLDHGKVHGTVTSRSVCYQHVSHALRVAAAAAAATG